MKRTCRWRPFVGHAFTCAAVLAALVLRAAADDLAVELPDGVQAVWDLQLADRPATSTRERFCLNGLWRWQPAEPTATKPPQDHWGYFKVPGCWPGITDYMQKDSQTVLSHPAWAQTRLADLTAAWYEREFELPEGWAGRRIVLRLEYVNSLAKVFVDGKAAGEQAFPGGELDLTAAFATAPGKHRLSLLVVALPLKAVLLSYHDSAAGKTEKGSVARRGLCGDVYLSSEPAGPRIADVRVETSYRKRQIGFDVALARLVEVGRYRLVARIGGWTPPSDIPLVKFTSPEFTAADLKAGRYEFRADWLPDQLWDLDIHWVHRLTLTLTDADDNTLDASLPIQFGFREFWIDGRDFYLNGSRIWLSAVPLDNAQISAHQAGYYAARESLEQLRRMGINFVYTHNYGCEPGSHLSFAEVLRAADDVGMLVSFSQPHFSHYPWDAPDADRDNGYARHAEFYVRAAQNHPSVVCYSMSHNATGYDEDMNPDLIDGIHDRRDQWAVNNVKLATRAEAIVRASTPRGSSITTPRAIWARCTRATSIPISCRSRSCPTGSSTGPPRASSRCFCANTGPRSPGTGGCTAAGSAASASSAAPKCPGNSAWPSGMPSSSATGRLRSASRKRPTSAGKRSRCGPTNSGIAGTIRST